MLGLALLAAASAAAGPPVTVEEALGLAFPGCDLRRESVFLTEAQVAEVARESGEEGQRALVTRYAATRGGELVGWAYLDTHRVRTLPETLLVAVAPDGSVRRVEVVAFREPREYLPRRGWYEQLEGRRLDPELSLQKGVRPVTGATLTARAATAAVRRVLAAHAVLARAGRAP